MATAKDTETEYDFTTVSTGEVIPETKIIFDTIGDAFTGTYLGMREVPNEQGNYLQARFEKEHEIYFVNANHSLREGLKTVRNGSVIRVTYTSDQDTGMALPMRIFMVEVGKAKRQGR